MLGTLSLAGAATAQPALRTLAGSQPIPPPAVLMGTWADPGRCPAREPASEPGASAVEIGPQWVRQGFMHCLARWHVHRGDARESHTWAHLQCGEDLPRDYRVSFLLRDGRLRIRWSEDFTTAALVRCR